MFKQKCVEIRQYGKCFFCCTGTHYQMEDKLILSKVNDTSRKSSQSNPNTCSSDDQYEFA